MISSHNLISHIVSYPTREQYWENWVNVKWWDNDIPGNCQMGCANPDEFMTATVPYRCVRARDPGINNRTGCCRQPPATDGQLLPTAHATPPARYLLLAPSLTPVTPFAALH